MMQNILTKITLYYNTAEIIYPYAGGIFFLNWYHNIFNGKIKADQFLLFGQPLF